MLGALVRRLRFAVSTCNDGFGSSQDGSLKSPCPEPLWPRVSSTGYLSRHPPSERVVEPWTDPAACCSGPRSETDNTNPQELCVSNSDRCPAWFVVVRLRQLARQSPNRSVARQSVSGDTAGCTWPQGRMLHASSHVTGRRAARHSAHGRDTADIQGTWPQGRVPALSAANTRSASRKARTHGAGNR